MALTTSGCSNTKLAVVGGSIVISVGALTALGVMGGIELHNKREAQRAAALAASQTDPPSSTPSDVPSIQPSLRPSSLPTLTSLPSLQPTVSSSPSAEPSFTPSISVAPSTSGQPSKEPSAIPSLNPSTLPSSSPTISTAPTFYPTPRPTNRPTPRPTNRPTRKPVSVPSSFRLRLHWQNGDLWQDDPREMWFCMACANCNANDFEDNCDVVNYCREGMMLALADCRPNKWSYATKFSLVPGVEGDQIKVTNSNLCVSLVSARMVKLETCNASKIEQRFTFRSEDNANEIAPAKRSMQDGVEVEKCLTQHHHPREGERIYSEICKLARISDTNLWTAY